MNIEPNSRVLNAHSWWLASELARRNPFLVVAEHHPMNFYDSLGLFDTRTSPLTHVVDINRPGSVHLFITDGFPQVGLVESLSFEDPHETVRRVEKAAGYTPSKAGTTPRSLIYRMIARTLAGLVDDRSVWDARIDYADDGYGPGEPRAFSTQFPLASAVRSLGGLPNFGLPGEPDVHIWALLRDQKPVALLDLAGRVITQTRVTDAFALYKSGGRNLTRVIGETLGEVLP